MKKRQEQLLNTIINHGNITLDYLLQKFSISRRTLYYDISSINDAIKKNGQIIKHEGVFSYIQTHDVRHKEDFDYFDVELRENYLLYLLLTNQFTNTEDIADHLKISKNTVSNSIQHIKDRLSTNGIQLKFNKTYTIDGDELKIRSLFILLDQYDFSNKEEVINEVKYFNKVNNLNLTDYSLFNLSNLIKFIKKRNSQNNELTEYEFIDEIDYSDIDSLLCTQNKYEMAYLKSYIMTLSNLKLTNDLTIELEIEKLIVSFENNTSIMIKNKYEFIRNLRRHFIASYYRIKFNFPLYNPLYEDIENKYPYLFRIIEDIAKNYTFLDLHFKNARKEELAYIVAYFGGFLYNNKDYFTNVIIVCPNGLVISNTLKMQLLKYIPFINIVEIMSVHEFYETKINYDYCISTVELDAKNLIVVNPLLKNDDIKNINSRLNHQLVKEAFTIENIIEVIEKHATIHQRSSLIKEIKNLMSPIKNTKGESPMLNELLTEDKIIKVKAVRDYKDAIQIASKPLLADKTIEPEYVEEMFNALDEFGPYIVLADRFALPHATSKIGVNKVGMSLLVVEEEVDLLGKPVNIFCVLATIDNESHLKALVSLSELLYVKENIDHIINGSVDEILKMVKGVS